MKARQSTAEAVASLREVQALRRLPPHPNLIALHEVLWDAATGRTALVFELMEANLYEALRGRRSRLPEPAVARWLWQALSAVDHLHRHAVFHVRRERGERQCWPTTAMVIGRRHTLFWVIS